MKSILRNCFAVIVGLVLGSMVNMAIVVTGPHFIAPPPGVDMSDPKSLAAAVQALEPKHFIFPFLAHAVGTFVGALAAAFVASSHRAAFAYAIGVLFLAGGIAASSMIPAPGWFITLDLVGAYLPMAWLATRVRRNVRPAIAAAS